MRYVITRVQTWPNENLLIKKMTKQCNDVRGDHNQNMGCSTLRLRVETSLARCSGGSREASPSPGSPPCRSARPPARICGRWCPSAGVGSSSGSGSAGGRASRCPPPQTQTGMSYCKTRNLHRFSQLKMAMFKEALKQAQARRGLSSSSIHLSNLVYSNFKHQFKQFISF